MTKLVISTGQGHDGEYDLDLEGRQFTGWELHIIKIVSGIRPMEFEEAVRLVDYDFLIALAVIALVRADKIDRRRFREASDLLMDAQSGGISIVEDEAAEGDALPPASEPEPSTSSDASPERSGASSNGSSDDRASIPAPTGSPGSATGSPE